MPTLDSADLGLDESKYCCSMNVANKSARNYPVKSARSTSSCVKYIPEFRMY